MNDLDIGIANENAFALPLGIVSQTTAILGIRGSGKTNTGVVIAEELLELGYQVVVVDPLDVWWGLKSSADGTEEGHPVVILGGHHADLPLSHENGKALADFAVEDRVPIILSLRHMRKTQQRSFVTAFCEQLYHRKGEAEHRTPLLVIIDEASSFIPQRVGSGEARMVGAVEDLVRRGRTAGLGVIAIDQRAASVNKDVLTQLELLVAHRHTSPQDRAALKEWVRAHDTEGIEKEFLAALASLELGEAYFWSPMLDVFEDVQVRLRHTYDSSKTPELGDELPLPDRMATVDLGVLEDRLAASIEAQKASDPKELKKRIAELEMELEAAPDERPMVDVDKRVREAVAEATSPLKGRVQELETKIKFAGSRLERVVGDIQDAASALHLNGFQPTAESERPPELKKSAPDDQDAKVKRTPPVSADISGPQQKILDALAAYESFGQTVVDRRSACAFAGYKVTGGYAQNIISSLRTSGLIDYPSSGMLELTPSGRAVATAPSLRSVKDVHARWLDICSGPQKKLLRVLIDYYPNSISRELLGDETGYEPEGGYFQNLVSSLSTLGAVEYPEPGDVRATDLLFPDLH